MAKLVFAWLYYLVYAKSLHIRESGFFASQEEAERTLLPGGSVPEEADGDREAADDYREVVEASEYVKRLCDQESTVSKEEEPECFYRVRMDYLHVTGGGYAHGGNYSENKAIMEEALSSEDDEPQDRDHYEERVMNHEEFKALWRDKRRKADDAANSSG
jgi:hypothetical protein